MRGRALVACVVVATLMATLQPAHGNAPGTPELGQIGGAGLGSGDSVAAAIAAPVGLAEFRPPHGDVRVLLISSGVDTSVLPPPVRGRVTRVSDANLPAPVGDPAGFGTYAASVVLQVAPGATITSLGVYDAGARTQPRWIWYAFAWAAAHAKDVDVVLFAMPPSELLDPVSASMATGEWNRMIDTMADRPLEAPGGAVLGIPIDAKLRRTKVDSTSWTEYYAAERFAYIAAHWDDVRKRIAVLTAAGVGVVVPSGDYGPGIQTLLGVANLPEVVTVGGLNGDAVSPKSASGPSIDLRVKPDLIAPTGVPGLLPPGSTLAKALAPKRVLDKTLALDWPYGEPSTDARARLDTTITSASVVAAAMGGMAASGVRDVARQRGALTAAAEPLDGVPVWRQGAGALQRMPDASRPVALAHASLGLEPESGEWTATVPFTGEAGQARASIVDHVGVDVSASGAVNVVRRVADGPRPSVSSSEAGVTVSAPVGDNPYPPGLWCGYITVTLPVVSADEDVPMCLVEGYRVRANAFYIHNDAAPHSSYTFFPALPPGASLLMHPLEMLPLNPLELIPPLYAKPTDEAGDATFHNMLPGYYTIKEFSDYGAPVVQTLGQSGSDALRSVGVDLGSNPAYQSMNALVLPPATQAECAAAGEAYPCDRALVTRVGSRFGPETDERTDEADGAGFVWEFTKHAYLIGPALPDGSRLRVVKGCDHPSIPAPRRDPQASCFKKMIGTAVVSRYIDMVPAQDMGYESVGAHVPLAPSVLSRTAGQPNGKGAWGFNTDTGQLRASFDVVNATASATLIGVAAYPFNLTTPNYSAHLSLNFAYELRNTVVAAIVAIGREARVGVVAPNATYAVPPTSTATSFDPSIGDWLTLGYGRGVANFEFDFLPRGATEGVIFLVFVPSSINVGGTPVYTVAESKVSDLSFSLNTWTTADWPGRRILDTSRNGHAFRFDSRFGAPRTSLAAVRSVFGEFTRPQIADPPLRRSIDNGSSRAEVSEDWSVLVHSPGDDARTVQLCDLSADDGTGDACRGTTKVLGSKATAGGIRVERTELQPDPPDDALPEAARTGSLFDPRRGVRQFGHPLAFACSILEVLARVPTLEANGRFWEQLEVPMTVLRDHSRVIEVQVEDEPDPAEPWSHIAYGRQGSLKGDPLEPPAIIPPAPGAGPSVPHECGEDACQPDVPARGAPVEVSPYVPFVRPPVTLRPAGWSLWDSLGGIGTSDPDASSWGPGQLDEYVRGTDNRLYMRRTTGGAWSGWVGLGYPSDANKVASAPGALSVASGRSDVFVAAEDGALWRRTFSGGKWGAWESLGKPCADALGLACGVRSGPDAASRAAGRIDVVAAGPDGRVWLRAFDGSSWRAWERIGAPDTGLAAGDPTVVSRGPGILDVFVRGKDDAIWQRSFDGSAWGEWRSIGAPLGASVGGGVRSSADALSRTPGTMDLFVRGPDDGLWTSRFNGERWTGWQALGGVISSGPGVVAWDADRMDVFALGRYRDVWHRSWSPEGTTLGS